MNDEGGYSLEKVTNSEADAKKEALSVGLVRDLAAVSTSFASSNVHGKGVKKSMEMEYSIKDEGNTQVIYHLQVRPLQNSEDVATSVPSYLDPQKVAVAAKTNPEDVVQGKTLLYGNSWVRKVTSNEQIIFADDLPSALMIYGKSQNKKGFKGVLIKATAPLTSHEGVMFRRTGLPVVVIENRVAYERAKSLIQDASPLSPVYLSPQNRDTVVSMRNLSGEAQSIVTEGLITFPGSLEHSVRVNPLLIKAQGGSQEAAIQFFSQLVGKYNTLLNGPLKGVNSLPIKGEDAETLQQLITKIATGNEAEAKSGLVTILRALHAITKKTVETPDPDKGPFQKSAILELMAVYSAVLDHTADHLIPVLAEPGKRMERLYFLKTLEALIFQPSSKDVVNGFSFLNSLSAIKMIEKLPKQRVPNFQLLALYKSSALSLEAGGRWEQFITNLNAESPASINELKLFVERLDKMQLTGLWLSLTFNEQCNLNKALDMFKDIKSQFAQNQVAFDWVFKGAAVLEMYEKNIELWENPQFYEKNLNNLTDTYNKWFLPVDSSVLKYQYNKAAPLGRMAILQFLERSVNVFDKIVKSVEGSAHDNEVEKIKAFATLLETYEIMMEATLYTMPEEPIFNTSKGSSLNKYLDGLREGMEYSVGAGDVLYGEHQTQSIGFDTLCERAKRGELTAAQFTASADFNVQPLLVGTQVDLSFNVTWPSRLEEYFTTFHQNMETAKNVMAQQNGLTKDLLAPRAKTVATLIENHLQGKLASIIVKDGKIELLFNIALRQHAAIARVTYDPKKPQGGMDLSIEAFGSDEFDRWRLLTSAFLVIGQQPGLSLKHNPKTDYRSPTGIEATIHMDNNFRNEEKLMEGLAWLLHKTTIGKSGFTKASEVDMELRKLIGTLSSTPSVTQYYEVTISMNNALMAKKLRSLENADEQMGKTVAEEAKEIALSTIKGMASYGLPADFANRDKDNEYSTSYKFKEYEHVGLWDDGTTMMPLMAAQACLCELLARNLIAKDDINTLIRDPKVLKAFPQVCKTLEEYL